MTLVGGGGEMFVVFLVGLELEFESVADGGNFDLNPAPGGAVAPGCPRGTPNPCSASSALSPWRTDGDRSASSAPAAGPC